MGAERGDANKPESNIVPVDFTRGGKRHTSEKSLGQSAPTEFPKNRIKRFPGGVTYMQEQEKFDRDPLFQDPRCLKILNKYKKILSGRDSKFPDDIREELERKNTISKLGEELAGTDEITWDDNPLYFYFLAEKYLKTKSELRKNQALDDSS